MKSKLTTAAILAAAFLFSPALPASWAAPGLRAKTAGAIKGRILKYSTRTPLAGVVVAVEGTALQTKSDSAGAYALTGVPIGFYVLTFQGEGYYEEKRTDVIVRSSRITFLNVELLETQVVREEVRVSAAPFPAAPARSVSRTEFNTEELRRDAASLGDLSRALIAVPGIVKTDEEANDMIVRGGSPAENGFYIDNIFIPNINHFPQQGASGGNICMLNMDFVESVRVFTGGFDASYGNRLSSILDISYREGDRDRVNGQVNWSAIGYGAQAEGPLAGGKGSWMVSGNRSFLKLIADLLGMENPADFGDIQGKIVYDLTPRDTLSLLALGGTSRTVYDPAGREKFSTMTAGFTWRHLWGESGYSDTSVSASSLNGTENRYDAQTRLLYDEYDYGQTWLTVRNVNHLALSSALRLTFGIEAQTTRFRNIDDFTYREQHLSGPSAAAFLTTTIQVFPSFSLSAGLRMDRLPFSERIHLAPRVSFVWTLSDRFSINGAYGRFFQPLPLFLIIQDTGNRDLQDLQADHAILGFTYLLGKDILLKLEAYDKEYRHMPMAAAYPYVFVLDDVNGDRDRFGYAGRLVDEGRAHARGVELTLQKKLTKNLYGLINLTYYRARYRDLMGTWRNRLFDNRFILSLSGGYKPNKYWEFNGRWVISGNRAFTPVNESSSAYYRWPVWDLDDIMSGHLQNYESLSVRVDRRFYFAKTNLVVFAGAWNLFGRKNELDRYWDIYASAYASQTMWGILPYVGLEFEF